jgi:hypothetical protein
MEASSGDTLRPLWIVTVRDLLGHNSVAMSLRYAHLAPDQRREAVAKLNVKPLLALAGESGSPQRISIPLN